MAEENQYQDPSKDLYAELADMTFPGLTVFARDCSLSDRQTSSYEAGTILREPGFTDATYKTGGMVTTHRFTILSNHMVDFGPFEHGTDWGLAVAQRNSHFKVLDVYTFEGKTQILLLHLPDNRYWKAFAGVRFSLEEDLIEKCRADFQAKIHEAIAPSLASPDWLGRCSWPIGVDDAGRPYDPESDLKMMFHPVGKDRSIFRECYGKYVCFLVPSLAGSIAEKYTDFEGPCDSLLTYCFINRDKKLAFSVLAVCRTDGKKLITKMLPDDAGVSVDLEEMIQNQASYIDEEQMDFDLPCSKHDLSERLNHASPELEKVRASEVIDPLRDPIRPDLLHILFAKDNEKGEEAMLESMALDQKGIYGTLLTKQHLFPDLAPGAHIYVWLCQHEDDGSPVLIY